MRASLRATMAALVVATFLAMSGAAYAADMPKLSGQVTDLVGGKVSASDTSVATAISALQSEHGINMRVLLDNSMNGADPGAYAADVAHSNLLGGHDALLVITFTDRKYGIWVGPGITNIGAGDIDNILNGSVAGHLRATDTAGAIVAAADGLGLASQNTAPAATSAQGGTTTPPTPSKPVDLSGLLAILAILLVTVVGFCFVILGALFVVAGLRARDSARSLSGKLASLHSQASKALVDTDEALKSAGDSADFAEAEFGVDTAAPFKKTLAGLTASMHDVYTLSKSLDDPDFGKPDVSSPALSDDSGEGVFGRFFARRVDASALARCAAYQSIIDKTAAINGSLSDQAAAIGDLRDMEKTLPSRLPGLKAGLAAARKSISGAVPQAESLQARSKSAYAAVATNLDGAKHVCDLAESDIATAAKAVSAAAGGPAVGGGALAAQSAEARLAKVATLLVAISTMSDQADSAAKSLPGHLAAAEAEVAKAATADTGNDVSGDEKTVASARVDLAKAKSLSASDPYAADQLALSALRSADSVLSEVRDAVDARKRKEAAAKEAYDSAQRSLAQAKSYIDSHRSVINSSARSSYERADSQFSQYQSSGMSVAQMVAAAAVMESIQNDADHAYSQARGDVSAHEESSSSYSSHDTYGGSSGGGSWGGGGGSFGGGSFGGGGGTSSGGGW